MARIRTELAELAGVERNGVSTETIGSKWGSTVSRKAVIALLVFLVVVTIYVSLRMEFKMAVAALVALLHDLIITAGIFALARFEVTPATVIALLTILGYSLYDTVVVFDKVRENTGSLTAMSRTTYSQATNLAVNQTMMRSLNTSLASLLPILGLLLVGSYLLGAETLKDLALALFVGVAAGAYSSIFIAPPIVAMWKEKEPRYAQLRARVERLAAQGPGAERPERPQRPERPARTGARPDPRPARRGPAARAGAGALPGAGRPTTSWRRRRPRSPRTGAGRGRPGASPPPAPEAAPDPAAPQAVRPPAVPPGQAPPALATDRRTLTVPIDIQRLRALIRDVPDFPKPGIVFKDITPLLANEVGFSSVIDETVVHFGRGNVDKVVGIEARGFILASPVAYHFGAGFVPVRKAGKLPYQVEAEEYALEYGSATLELHADAIVPGERVLIVDDVLATGGTARAAARLVERLGGKVIGIATLIELEFLEGRKLIEGYEFFSLVRY